MLSITLSKSIVVTDWKWFLAKINKKANDTFSKKHLLIFNHLGIIINTWMSGQKHSFLSSCEGSIYPECLYAHVFSCLCLWHIKQVWNKNLKKEKILKDEFGAYFFLFFFPFLSLSFLYFPTHFLHLLEDNL